VLDMQRRNLSLADMAAELTKKKIKPLRGGAWHAMTVKRLVDRIEAKHSKFNVHKA